MTARSAGMPTASSAPNWMNTENSATDIGTCVSMMMAGVPISATGVIDHAHPVEPAPISSCAATVASPPNSMATPRTRSVATDPR